MALKTRDDYLAALRKLKPNIFKFGKLIEDVTTHPATKRTVERLTISFMYLFKLTPLVDRI